MGGFELETPSQQPTGNGLGMNILGNPVCQRVLPTFEGGLQEVDLSPTEAAQVRGLRPTRPPRTLAARAPAAPLPGRRCLARGRGLLLPYPSPPAHACNSQPQVGSGHAIASGRGRRRRQACERERGFMGERGREGGAQKINSLRSSPRGCRLWWPLPGCIQTSSGPSQEAAEKPNNRHPS